MAENLQSVLTSCPLFGHPLCLVSVLPFTHTGCSFRLVLPFFGLTCSSRSSSLWLESGSFFFFFFFKQCLDLSFTESRCTLSFTVSLCNSHLWHCACRMKDFRHADPSYLPVQLQLPGCSPLTSHFCGFNRL